MNDIIATAYQFKAQLIPSILSTVSICFLLAFLRYKKVPDKPLVILLWLGIAHGLFSAGWRFLTEAGVGHYVYRCLHGISLSISLYLPYYCYLVSSSSTSRIKENNIIIFIGCLVIFATSTPLFVSHLIAPGVTGVVYGPLRSIILPLGFASSWFALVVCILGYTKAQTSERQVAALNCLFAISLFLIITGFLRLAHQAADTFDQKIAIAYLFPVSIQILVIILVFNSSKRHVIQTDARRFMPLTREKRIYDGLSEAFANYSLGRLQYKTTADEINRLLITYKIEKLKERNNGQTSIQKVADNIGLTRSGLSKILKRMDIKI